MFYRKMISGVENLREYTSYLSAKESNNEKLRLNLRSKKISSLPKHIFGLEDIPYLEVDLGYNQKTINSGEVFSQLLQLKNLKSLGFMANDLTHFDADLGEFENLECLDLWGNKNLILNDNFQVFKNLKMLRISSCNLKEFPEVITRFERLETLMIGNNNLKTIPDSIAELKNLRTLEIKSNKISKLPEGLFALEKLEQLNISSNSFVELPAQLNRLPALSNCIFKGNSIDLEQAFDVLSTVSGLRELDFSGQNLSVFPVSIQKLTQLEILNLSDNELIDLPALDDAPPKLRHVEVEGNSELSIGAYLRFISKLPGYTKLIMPRVMRWAEIPDDVEQCSFLEEIEIPVDGITCISEKMFELEQLRSVFFRGGYTSTHKLENIPDLFDRLKSLKKVSFSGCRGLFEFPQSLYKSHTIQELRIWDCDFMIDFKKLGLLKELNSLDLSVNKQEDLDEIAKLSKLGRLHITGEAVEKLPDSFMQLKHLKEFSLGSLKNLDIDDALGKLPYLEEVAIYREVDQNLTAGLKELKRLRKIAISGVRRCYTHDEMLDLVEQLPDLRVLEYWADDTPVPERITLFNRLERCTIYDKNRSQEDNSEVEYDLNIANLDPDKVLFSGSLRYAQLRKMLKKLQSLELETPTQKMMAFGFMTGRLDRMKKYLTNPFGNDLTGVVIYIYGKPTLNTAKELTENLKGRGARLSKKLDEKVTHVLISSQFKATEMVEILKSDKPLVLEDYFKNQVFSEDTPYLMEEGSEEMTDQITRLLRTEEEDNTPLVLELIGGGGANKTLISYLYVIHLFHNDTEIRKKSRGIFRKFASTGLQTFLKNSWKDGFRKKDFSDGVFVSLFMHQQLDLVDCIFALKMLQFHSGAGEHVFRRLMIRGAKIAVFPENFAKLDFLENIFLQGFGIFDFKNSVNHIRHFNLKSFGLSDYELDEFPLELFDFKAINSISISYKYNSVNEILHVPPLPENQSLTSLNFANFQLENIENLSSVSVNLTDLTIHNCRLDQFPAFVGYCKRMLRLRVSGGNFTEVNFDFGLLPVLETLSISECPVTAIADTFGTCENLYDIAVSNTKLAGVPLSLFAIRLNNSYRAINLNLSDNEIKTFELPGLQKNRSVFSRISGFFGRSEEPVIELTSSPFYQINLRNNRLEEVPEMFGRLTIDDLNLSGNPISILNPESIKNVKRTVGLGDTLITDIPIGIFKFDHNIDVSSKEGKMTLPDPDEIPEYRGRKSFFFNGMTEQDSKKMEMIRAKQTDKG